MSLLRRSFAALAGLFLLQLTLLGSGTLCATHYGDARSDATVHAMGGMREMSRVTVAQRSVSAISDASGPRSPQDCGGLGQHDGCGLPWAPGQCSSMTACDVSAMPGMSAVASATSRVVTTKPLSSAVIHSGPSFAPELPPPRA